MKSIVERGFGEVDKARPRLCCPFFTTSSETVKPGRLGRSTLFVKIIRGTTVPYCEKTGFHFLELIKGSEVRIVGRELVLRNEETLQEQGVSAELGLAWSGEGKISQASRAGVASKKLTTPNWEGKHSVHRQIPEPNLHTP